jgi:hypothetical protein
MSWKFWKPKPAPAPLPQKGKIFLMPGEKAPSSIPSGVQQVTVDPSKPLTSYGSGGSSGGGSSSISSGGQSQAQILEAQRQAKAQRQAEDAEKARQEQIRRQQEQARQEQAQKQQEKIIVSSTKSSEGAVGSRGSVKVGGSYYVGSSVVPGTGMTANEYRRQIQRKAVQEGRIEKKDVGRTTFTITPEQKQVQRIKGVSTKTPVTGTGRLFLTSEEAGMEAQDNSVFFVRAEDIQSKPYVPLLTPTSMFVSEKFSDIKESRVGKVASFVWNPLGKEVRVIGGRIIPSEKFENISPSTQRLITFSQPETILLSARFPSIKDVGVQFAGVQTAKEGGVQKTFLKFKTSAGERGGAIGISEQTGSRGDLIVGRTDVVGYKGRSVVDLTRANSKTILRDVQKFGVKEATITIPKGDSFYQLSAGKVGVVGKKGLTPFVGADFGTVKDATSTILGKTIIQGGKGDLYSFGQIKDLSALNLGSSGVSSITTSGTTTTATQSVAATQSAIRSAVGGIRAVPSTSLGVATSPISLTEINQQQITPSISSLQLTKVTATQKVISPQRNLVAVTPRVSSRVSTKTRVSPSIAQVVSQQPMQKTEQALRLNLGQGMRTNQIPLQTQQQALRQTQQLKSQGLSFTPPKLPQIPKTPPVIPFPVKGFGKPLKQPRGLFPVLGRRFGKFKIVGVGKTEREAFAFGKKWVSKGLGATFKIPKARARQLPGYRTKITKEGKVLYIEPEKRRLKKRGVSKEVAEIMQFRKLKGGKKK